MNETILLEQVVSEILRDYADSHPVGSSEAVVGWAPELWATLDEAGLPLIGRPEERGGAGGDWPELAAVLRTVGRFAAPVPLAETCGLAGWLLDEAGLPLPAGPLTVAPVRARDEVTAARDGDGWRLGRTATRVPWATQAAAIVVLAADEGGQGYVVASVPPSACRIEPGVNLAGEPRERVSFAGVRLPGEAVASVALGPDDLLTRGALVRALQMVGALDRVLELTVEYARVRIQFGRPIGRFQAVQQGLARLAGEVMASAAAVEGAVMAAMAGPCEMEVAAAKVRTAEAAALATRIAHQLHGAIGFTGEHQLHRFTTRLWSWRDEFGPEREWAARLGRFAAASGPEGYWAWLTRERHGSEPADGEMGGTAG